MSNGIARSIGAMPIRYKMVCGFLLVLISTIVFIYSYYPAIYRQLSIDNIRAKDHHTAEQIALSVGVGMEHGDYSIIKSAFRQATTDSSILYILFFDNENKLVADYNPNGYNIDSDFLLFNMTESDEDSKAIHTVRQPVTYNQDSFGTLVLTSSMKEVDINIRQAYHATLYICLAILIIGIILSLAIAALITKPLSNLTKIANQVAEGDLRVKIDSNYYDEVGVLGRAMSNMLHAIRSGMARIENLHQKNVALLESAGEGIVGLNHNSVITFINPAAAKILCANANDLIGKSFPGLVAGPHGAITGNISKAWTYLDKSKQGKTQEVTFFTADNPELPVELLCTPLHDPSEESGIVLFFRDITDRKKAQKASEDAAERYRQMFKNIKAVKLLIDQETGYIVDANEAAEQFYGYNFSDLDSIKIAKICNNFSLDNNVAKSTSDIQVHVLASGETRDVEVHSGPVDISGRRYIYAIIQDVTEQLKAQDELRLERDFTSSIISTAAALIIVLNKDGNIIRFNNACEKVTKYSSYEVVGRQICEFEVTDDDTEGFASLTNKGMPSSFEAVWKTKDGEQRTISWNNSNIFDHKKNLKYVIATGIDITDRLHQEHELRKLSAAVFQSPSIICITGIDGIAEYVNPQFVSVTGFDYDDVIGQRLNILKSDAQTQETYAELWETITSGGTWEGLLKNRKKNGQFYWERKTISPILNEKGEMTNYLSIGWDITNELASQQKIAEADKMSAVGMLAAGVAHEFKNYLGGIIGNATFALSTFEDDDGIEIAKDVLEKIVDMGEKANDVAMSLLSYSKGKAAEQSSEDLQQIIQRTIMLVEKELKHLSIHIETYYHDVPHVKCSASRIQQLLLNLIINAQHAIKEDGVITIGLVADKKSAYIKVGDTGAGINNDILQKIFDPFYSTKGVWGKDETVGTGMGLSICRNIAREHKGDLTVMSVKGKGTTFTLSLPLTKQNNRSATDSLSSIHSTIIMFTNNAELFGEYSNSAKKSSIDLLLAESIESFAIEVEQLIDIVVCDAQFSGKVELLRVVEQCNRLKLPCIVINSGSKEYQLEELYAMVDGHYEGTPDLVEILSRAKIIVPQQDQIS